MGIGFGALTFGKADKQFTVSAGRPFVLSGNQNDLGDLVLVGSAQLRVSNSYALISENWIFPTVQSFTGSALPLSIHGLAFREIKDNGAFDFGFVGILGTPVLLPWVDWTYNLGTSRHRSRALKTSVR
jgi:hypothetical protein